MRDTVERLAELRRPFIVGVRHHSPVIAAAMPALLDAAAPDVVYLELAEELQPWLEWLGHPDLVAPVALAAARRDGRGLVFYPYADFSPELAALRWAVLAGVPARAFDLPVARSMDEPGRRHGLRLTDDEGGLRRLQRAYGVEDSEELWDRMVEAPGAGQPPEAVRRAALAFGWALRAEDEVDEVDLGREAWMRDCLRREGFARPAAVVGAYHGAAFLDQSLPPREGGGPSTAKRGGRTEVVSSIIPYSFELLDSRSGYPAGIRDPEWQQAVFEAGAEPARIEAALTSAVVRVCRRARELGHPSGVPDEREAVRVAVDLARLRGLPAPGRRELVEALQTCLAQGEPLGRGRAVAAAMGRVLVGHRGGSLARGTPRSGLAPHVEELVGRLRMPGAGGDRAVELRLDPLRSALDRRRHVALERLAACGVPYGQRLGPPGVEQLTERWEVRWTAATSAMLELAALFGATLEQAAEGALRRRLADGGGGAGPALLLDTLAAAAACGLGGLALDLLRRASEELPRRATLPELIGALELCDRFRRGHEPGWRPDAEAEAELSLVEPELEAAAMRQVEGVAGSDRLDDARALLAIVRRFSDGQRLGGERLRWSLRRMGDTGSPLMQGAAGAVRVLLGHDAAKAFAARLASWVDAAAGPAAQSVLAARLKGALVVATPLLEASAGITGPLVARVDDLDDEAFLLRLPALREAFEVLSPAARERFLGTIRAVHDREVDLRLDHAPDLLARWADADRAGTTAAAALPEAPP
ncbi:MAG TPA: DUF5682 family protein [Terriglobales bacterium]|nr:DUF5682 family protein [Terriglobales bacterium]